MKVIFKNTAPVYDKPMNMKNISQLNRARQSGNALFFILIAVAMLGALSFAVSQGGRSSGSGVSAEKARLAATDLIDYSNTVANAAAQLRLRGYSLSELSFENDIVSGYSNGNCAEDLCKIFAPAGGGVSYLEPPKDIFADTPAPDYEWHFYGDNAIQGAGMTCANASCADIIMVLDELDLSVCQQLNDLLGVSANLSDAPPTDADVGNTKYTGSFSYSETIGDSDASLDGLRSVCIQKTTSPAEYVYYRVLISQ